MRVVIVFVLVIVFASNVHGQQSRGKITCRNNQPLPNAYILNNSSGIATTADSLGHFSINAAKGDKLTINNIGFQPTHLFVDGNTELKEITLFEDDVQLTEVEVLSDLARFKRDSALRHLIYKKQLKYANSKTKKDLLVKTGEVGMTINGAFSEIALALSGKKKRYKAFAKTLAEDERQHFIMLRYSTAIVSKLTGLDETLATQFIRTHPIPYDFARSAGELELKSWILNEYRTYRN